MSMQSEPIPCQCNLCPKYTEGVRSLLPNAHNKVSVTDYMPSNKVIVELRARQCVVLLWRRLPTYKAVQVH